MYVVAAGAVPEFFGEVVALLVASALVAYLCHRLRVTPIVSFLVTGMLIGPHALGLVRDRELIEAAAEVGVVLLLFTIGVELSLAKLGRIRRLIFLGGGLQVGLSVSVVAGLVVLAGASWQTGVFTGFLVALSSTAIVMKLLSSRGRTATGEGGEAALGILIFQDLAVVAMVLIVPMLGGGGGEGGAGAGIALALGKAGAIVALVLVAARRLMPIVLEAVARTCSQEIFLLTVVAICFGTAWLTSLAGVSLSLGAFLAGLLVSESRFSEMALGEIQPLQILFSATFFVSVGLLLDVGFLLERPLAVAAMVGAVLAIKTLTTAVSLKVLGYGAGTTAFASLLLAQVGEFSFVLERTGREAGLSPVGMAESGPQLFIAATVLLMIATPYLGRLGEHLRGRAARGAADTALAGGAAAGGTATAAASGEAGSPGAPAADGEPAAEPALSGHVIVAGYGETGRALARTLHELRLAYLVVTLSPDGARDAEQKGLRVLRGTYWRGHELGLAGTRRARLLVVADDDLETTLRVVRAVRAFHPGLPILARTARARDAAELLAAGAARVVPDDREGVLRAVTEALAAAGVDLPEAAAAAERLRPADAAARPLDAAGLGPSPIRLTDGQRTDPRCPHATETGEVIPGTGGCAECLAAGDDWVHLRLCMACGHVGCCDSSPNRHASRHFAETGHPVMRSFQPGEEWAWCFTDRVTL
jgi:CPA2 family monovalent cation:H+ antiporter-2